MKQCVVVQDLQGAQAGLASPKQARQADEGAIAAPYMQHEDVAQLRPSSLQVRHLLKLTLYYDFASVLTMMLS